MPQFAKATPSTRVGFLRRRPPGRPVAQLEILLPSLIRNVIHHLVVVICLSVLALLLAKRSSHRYRTKTGDLLDAKALDQQPPLIRSSIPAQKVHPPAQRAALGLVDEDWRVAREELLLRPAVEAGVVGSKQLPQARKIGGVPEGEVSGEFALHSMMPDDGVCEDRVVNKGDVF